jgi:hypothetical protein
MCDLLDLCEEHLCHCSIPSYAFPGYNQHSHSVLYGNGREFLEDEHIFAFERLLLGFG